MKTPRAAPVPRVYRDRRDDRYDAGRPTPPKRAEAGYVVSVQDDTDTVTVDILDEQLPGVIPLGEMPPVGAIVEVEARGDLLVIPLWFPGPEPPEWVQDPDFTVATLGPWATYPDLQFYEHLQVNSTSPSTGSTAANYAAAVAALNGGIDTAWAATEGPIPPDSFLTDPTGGVQTFPADDYSRQQWTVNCQSATGDPFDGVWNNQVTATHTGWGLFTKPTNLPPYTSGPGVEWETDQARMVGATINVTLTYFREWTPPPDATISGGSAGVEVYLYRYAANNNLMIAPKDARLIHEGSLPLATSSGGPGAAVVTFDVVLDEDDLTGWDYMHGLMFYSVLVDPAQPLLTTLATHSSVIAARYTADIQINVSASSWTVRPPRWREPTP